MVVVKDIEFYSVYVNIIFCHFSGKPMSRTFPTAKLSGLSKIPRLVDMFSRRLQVQERLTTEIAEALEDGFAA